MEGEEEVVEEEEEDGVAERKKTNYITCPDINLWYMTIQMDGIRKYRDEPPLASAISLSYKYH